MSTLMGKVRSRRTVMAVAAVVVVSFALSGSAAIPDPSGVIHGCYLGSAGIKSLYIVDSATTTCPGVSRRSTGTNRAPLVPLARGVPLAPGPPLQ